MKSVVLFLLSLLLGGSSLVEAQLDSSIFIGCGNTTTCFMTVPSSCDTECTGPNDCDLVAVIEDIPAESKFRIQLHSDRSYSYMALGFSTDRRMAFSDVVGCDRSDANTANAKDTYNVEGYLNTYDADQSAISNFSFNITGNMFSCQFDRSYLSPPNAGGFALDGTFILFLGARSSGFSPANSRFEMHTNTPCISSAPVNLLDPNPVTVPSPSPMTSPMTSSSTSTMTSPMTSPSTSSSTSTSTMTSPMTSPSTSSSTSTSTMTSPSPSPSSGQDLTLVKTHGILIMFAWMVLVLH